MIYNFVVISSEDESFIREFELEASNTLFDFHNALQEELEYDMSQLASFFTASENWEKEEEFTLFDMGSGTAVMDEVTIDDIAIEKNQKLLYIFDLFNERAFFIEIIGTRKPVEGRNYPECTRSHGKPPVQVLFASFSSSIIIDNADNDYNDDDLDDDPDIPDFTSMEDLVDI